MAKTKVNVLSLDQAPKTRAAGYGKVIDSMRKEINEAMDQIILDGSEVICDYMNNHGNRVPIEQLMELEPGASLSFEVKREKVKPNGGFLETVGHPAFLGQFNHFTNNCYWFEEEGGPIKPGEKALIIVVEKDAHDPKMWRVHAEQLEYPGKGIMLMDGLYFHNPDVSEEKFQEILGLPKASKEEIKQQIKENISEEIELEEKENKSEGNSKQQKKGWGDTIRGWLGKK